MRRFFRRPTASAVIATVALVAAMGGTSYAAKLITGKNIKNSSVTGKDIKNSSLTGSDIKNKSLTTSDLKASSVAALKGATGPAGAAGAPGPAGVGVVTYVASDPVTVADGAEAFIEAICPAGFVAIGGGQLTSDVGLITPNSSFPSDGTGSGAFGSAAWGVYMDNFNGSDLDVSAVAVCAPATIAKTGALKSALNRR
jgi:hypothetical protein